MRDMLCTTLRFASQQRNIWWGVSVEDKSYGLPRVKHLQAAPAAVKFLSIEPLLEDIGEFDVSGIEWAIVGGESGHGARPMDRRWVENLLKLCRRERVAFFFKQWGGVHKSEAGRKLRGRTYDEMPKLKASRFPEKTIRAGGALFWKNRAKTRWPKHLDALVPLRTLARVAR
jgi:protein gp37